MHQLIHIVVHDRETPEDATAVANTLFEGRDAPLRGPYDYGRAMGDPDARWRDDYSDEVRETGAIRADSDRGREEIEDSWQSTKAEMCRDLAVLREAFDTIEDDEELLNDPIVEADVEEWDPLGLFQGEDDRAETYNSWVRRAMYNIGSYRGPTYYLYEEHRMAVRTPHEYRELCDDLDSLNENERAWVVPMDVHY